MIQEYTKVTKYFTINLYTITLVSICVHYLIQCLVLLSCLVLSWLYYLSVDYIIYPVTHLIKTYNNIKIFFADCKNMTKACLLLMGFIFGMNLSHLSKLKYTSEVFKKLLSFTF